MALIPCPECKKQISDTAAACPHCGYRVLRVEFPCHNCGAGIRSITGLSPACRECGKSTTAPLPLDEAELATLTLAIVLSDKFRSTFIKEWAGAFIDSETVGRVPPANAFSREIYALARLCWSVTVGSDHYEKRKQIPAWCREWVRKAAAEGIDPAESRTQMLIAIIDMEKRDLPEYPYVLKEQAINLLLKAAKHYRATDSDPALFVDAVLTSAAR
jgi:DNA-directed RNA polymerase subunit RPC12/RpoP